MEESGIEQYQYKHVSASIARWPLYMGLVLRPIGELTDKACDSSLLSLGWIP